MLLRSSLLKGGTRLNSMMNWDEFNETMKNVFGRTFIDVDDLYFNVVREKRFGESIEIDDRLALDILKELKPICGEICVITDLCYRKDYGPFTMHANQLDKFVNDFSQNYGETFYSTDVIIVNFEQQMIWVLFHEGMSWLSKL